MCSGLSFDLEAPDKSDFDARSSMVNVPPVVGQEPEIELVLARKVGILLAL